MIAVLEGNIDDNAQDIRIALKKLAAIHLEQSDRKWQVRCGDARYLGPWIASVLYAAVLVGRSRNQNPRIKLPHTPPKLQAYCVFSGMAREFQNGPSPDPDHPECETLPLLHFHEAYWNLPDGVVKLVKRHMFLGSESEDRLRTCIQEVVQNVIDHSRSPVGGVMSARYMSESKEVRVGIVDRGVGIRSSLHARHAAASTSFEALSLVVKGGYSSQSRPNNMGLGVSNLFDLVRHVGGEIAMISGDAIASSRSSGYPRVELLDFSFPGTGVFFTLPLAEKSIEGDG